MNRGNRKVTKLERTNEKKRIVEHRQHGEGLYVFRNRNAHASLELPKPAKDGKKWVEPGATWEGDDYFFSMIPKEAVLVRTVSEPKKEETKMEQKLILDQPEQVTKSGKVEHRVAEDLPLNEVSPEGGADAKERLLTEDPLAGVTIIRD
jgi:hypothetical protein